jgi:glycine cleavage system regulatory protein/surfactin synthase thioesterase subunit
MTAVGIDDPVMLIGHSFGGGVAIKVAELRPDMASFLVLLNAVGGLSARPPWEWFAAFVHELWPLPEAMETVQAMRADIVPNLLRNPLGIAKVATVARRADLRSDLDALRRQGTPVLALTSEGDTVIPKSAFDALCDALGADGRVVHGKHSWLLADPDSFGEVLGSVVDVQITAHRNAGASARSAEMLELIKGSRLAQRPTRAMLRSAPPLWLMSEPPALLIGDLALCHPSLNPNEVRAIARPIEGSSSVRLTIVTSDRKGLLADSAAVLSANNLSISHASAATWRSQKIALHSFTVRNGADLNDASWNALGDDLRRMATGANVPALELLRVGPLRVTMHGTGAGRSLLEVTARDRVGLLALLCTWLADLDVNIESMHARTVNGTAHDTFLIAGNLDEKALLSRVKSRERSR